MGYYTKYSLEMLNGEHHLLPEVLKELKKMDSYQPFSDSGECDDECTWKNHEKEMKKISKLFPDAVFKLVGIGQGYKGSLDMWHKYFKNGKMQECRIEAHYPPFDESKLE